MIEYIQSCKIFDLPPEVGIFFLGKCSATCLISFLDYVKRSAMCLRNRVKQCNLRIVIFNQLKGDVFFKS